MDRGQGGGDRRQERPGSGHRPARLRQPRQRPPGVHRGRRRRREGFTFAAGKILVPDAYGEGTEDYKVATDFVDATRQAYGEAPDTFAGHAYDALYLVVEAAKRVDGDVTPEALRDEIEKTTGFVGIGGTFTFSPTDHNGLTQDDLAMYEIADGDWTLAQ